MIIATILAFVSGIMTGIVLWMVYEEYKHE